MRVLAGIVVYNPEIERLKENIDALVEQVEHIVCIDNDSANKVDIIELLSTYKNVDLQLYHNKENLGIATALHQIMDIAGKGKFDWVLTMDQDSICRPKLINEYKKYAILPKVGLMTCVIEDRNFNQQFPFLDGEDWKIVRDCITSGAFMRVKAYEQTSGYDEKMFIDFVDTDICCALKRVGWNIIRIRYNGLLHELGKGENIRLLGKLFIVANESVLRHYYIARNRFYLTGKYRDQLSFFYACIREIRDWLFVVLYEKEKINKLKKRCKGLIDSIKMMRMEENR